MFKPFLVKPLNPKKQQGLKQNRQGFKPFQKVWTFFVLFETSFAGCQHLRTVYKIIPEGFNPKHLLGLKLNRQGLEPFQKVWTFFGITSENLLGLKQKQGLKPFQNVWTFFGETSKLYKNSGVWNKTSSVWNLSKCFEPFLSFSKPDLLGFNLWEQCLKSFQKVSTLNTCWVWNLKTGFETFPECSEPFLAETSKP